MAYIKYEYDPNVPNDKERAYSKAVNQLLLGLLFLWGSIGSIVYFISSTFSLVTEHCLEDMFYSTGLLCLMSVIDFFILFGSFNRKDRKMIASKYFLFFLGGTIDLGGTIVIFSSIYTLCHYEYGLNLLVSAILVIILTTTIVYLIYRKIEGYAPINIKLFAEKEFKYSEEKNTQSAFLHSSKHIFCHKCGKYLPTDSNFCVLCGTALRRK